jgi:hypothetical protein
MTRSQYIHYGVIALTVILFFILGLGLLKKLNLGKDGAEMAASEERVKAAEKERDIYRGLYDQAIKEKMELDSLLTIKESKIEIRYKNIPVVVRDLSKDELRRAITNY